MRRTRSTASALVVGDTASSPELPHALVGARKVRVAALLRGAGVRSREELWIPLDPSGAPRAEALLASLRVSPPFSSIRVCFRNAAAGSRLLSQLAGCPSPYGAAWSEADVQKWLSDLGWKVTDREGWSGVAPPPPLAADTAQTLKRLFIQFNRSAGDECVAYTIAPSALSGARRAWEPERLSVILEVDERADGTELDRTLFALACQPYRPLELVVAGDRAWGSAGPLVARYQRLAPFDVRWAGGASPADRLARALGIASGRYWAFSTPGCVVYPDHYGRQITRLKGSACAWTVARARQVYLGGAHSSGQVLTKKTVPLGSTLEPFAFSAEPAALFTAVIDRARLGAFRLADDGGSRTERFRALTALFKPAFQDGLPELDLRISETGGRTLPPAGRPSLAVLTRDDRWTEALRAAQERAASSGLTGRVVARLNREMKERTPRVHAGLAAALRRFQRQRPMDRPR